MILGANCFVGWAGGVARLCSLLRVALSSEDFGLSVCGLSILGLVWVQFGVIAIWWGARVILWYQVVSGRLC